MEFYLEKYNAKVRITCGGIPLDQFPEENNPLNNCHRAYGAYLAEKFGNKKDLLMEGQKLSGEEEDHGEKQSDTVQVDGADRGAGTRPAVLRPGESGGRDHWYDVLR